MSTKKYTVEYHIPYVHDLLHPKQHLDVYTPYDANKAKHVPALSIPQASYNGVPIQPSPVVVFVHGGGWRRGDKNDNPLWGVARVGRALAKAGYVVVVPSYRLSKVGILSTLALGLIYTFALSLIAAVGVVLPGHLLFGVPAHPFALIMAAIAFVGISSWLLWLEETGGNARHPQHAEDIAAVVKWTLDKVQYYGGDRSAIFLAGHSAGAHLVCLLTLDRHHLREQGIIDTEFDKCVKGVVGISGVYNLRRLHNFTICGLPLARWSFVSPAFSPDQYDAASPVSIRTYVPQHFLLLIGERDHLPLKADHEEMQLILRAQKIDVEAREIRGKTHRKILFDVDTNSDRTTREILDWLSRKV